MLNSWLWLSLLVTVHLSQAKITGPTELQQGFFFDHLIPGQTWTIPTTEQCSTIPLKWDRGAATGPSPAAPYSLQVYTSAFTTPFIIDAGEGASFDWAVPFDNGTVYQVCMFASNGVTGGCWDSFTVIPGTDGCQNVTFPDGGRLNVSATISETETQVSGILSQSGWIEECSDLQLKPNDGQPPYVMTIAPTLAPPINITSDNTNTISWTVNLGRSLPFYVSLASSDGKTWSNGPLHVGAGTTGCTVAPSGKVISESKAIGASVGSLIAGLVLGALCAFLVTWLRDRKHQRETDPSNRVDAFTTGVPSATSPKPEDSLSPISQPEILSPLRYSEPGSSRPNVSNPPTSPYVTTTTTVVHRHQDGGYRYPPTDENRQVVELPPEYMSESGGESHSSAAQRLRGGTSSHDDEHGEGPSRGHWRSPIGSFRRGEKTGMSY